MVWGKKLATACVGVSALACIASCASLDVVTVEASAPAQNAPSQSNPTPDDGPPTYSGPSSREIYIREFAGCMRSEGHEYIDWNPDDPGARDPNRDAAQQGGDAWLKSDMRCRRKVNEQQSEKAEQLAAAYERKVARAYLLAVEQGRITHQDISVASNGRMTFDDYARSFPGFQDVHADSYDCLRQQGMPVEVSPDGSDDFLERYHDYDAPKADRSMSRDEFYEKYGSSIDTYQRCMKPLFDFDARLHKELARMPDQ